MKQSIMWSEDILSVPPIKMARSRIVEFKNIGVILVRKVHGKNNWLIDIPRVGITDKSKVYFIAIVSGGCAFGCL